VAARKLAGGVVSEVSDLPMQTFSERQAPNVNTVSMGASLTSLTTPTAAPKERDVMETSDGHDVPLATPDTGNGADEFPPVCAHCGAPATTDSPIQLCAVEGEELLLHRACQEDWLASTDDLSIPPCLLRSKE
jgi:hypothetical protein